MISKRPNVEVLAEKEMRWFGARNFDPYDRSARENLAEVQFELYKDKHPLSTVARGRLLLDILFQSFPTPKLVSAYFENLECLLGDKERQPVPGRVVLGLGSGRCGSTTLAGMLASIDRSCCTHENPPLIYWTPEQEQLEFHMRRFKLLSEYYPLIFDASHWWLPALDRVFDVFPDAKVVGLYRDVVSCTQSFMKIKGSSWGSINHWVASANGIWRANFWDPTYPTYPLPQNSDDDPDTAKYGLIARYVNDYNTALFALSERLPEQVLLVRTEELSRPPVQKTIFDFLGFRGEISQVKLNIGTTDDGVDTFRI